MIASCYRRDEAQNPELFADALALVLGDYPSGIVELAVDPRTGVITKFPMGLPNVGQIKQFLDDLLAQRDRLQRYAALPKFERRPALPPTRDPNLFVPVGFHRYAKMAARHEREPGFCRFENGRTCQDGVARDGLWVPLEWWQGEEKASEDVLVAAARRAFERECIAEGIDPAGGVSPSLRKLLGAQHAASQS